MTTSDYEELAEIVRCASAVDNYGYAWVYLRRAWLGLDETERERRLAVYANRVASVHVHLMRHYINTPEIFRDIVPRSNQEAACLTLLRMITHPLFQPPAEVQL